MMNLIAWLQLFAEAGTLVNASTGYVNAQTGAKTDFSGANTLAPELKTFYDTELLENARVEMIYAQFAKKQQLPASEDINDFGDHRTPSFSLRLSVAFRMIARNSGGSRCSSLK